jgi:hypothetical protein
VRISSSVLPKQGIYEEAVVKLSVLSVVLFLLLSVLSMAQVKPPTSARPIQKGAAKGQTKIQGQNLKAAVNGSLNPPINGHSVTLSCTPSISGGVTGYNFYSGATKGAESSTPLNSTPTSTCSWIDGTVIGTNTYWYVAKAYCPTCSPQLSVASNEIGPEVIPADAAPAPPTGLSVGTISNNTVPLFWNAPLPQNGYDVVATEIFRGTSPTLPSPPRIATVPGWIHSFTDEAGCGGIQAVCYYEARNYSLFQDNGFMLSLPSNIVKVTMP